MDVMEAKMSLLHTIAEVLKERGFETSADNDSGEVVIEFEGHILVIGREDIFEMLTCSHCEEEVHEEDVIRCGGCEEVVACGDCAGLLFDGKQECESCAAGE